MLLLRCALHERSGAQSRERFDFAGSAATRGPWLFRGPASWADSEFLRRSNPKKNAFFGIAAGRCRCSGDSPRTVYDVPPARLYARHRGGNRISAEALRSRAFAGTIRLNKGAARDAAHILARGVPGKA